MNLFQSIFHAHVDRLLWEAFVSAKQFLLLNFFSASIYGGNQLSIQQNFFFILELIDEFIKTSCFRYAGHMGNIYHIDFSEECDKWYHIWNTRPITHSPPSLHPSQNFSEIQKNIFC